MDRPLGAQISHMLKDRGVEVIFGIPGVHNQEMYRGIEEAGLRHVLARHEQGAGFMADGYARATGRAGVCYVITGPGLCNIMTPMGQAYSDSVPMLVISSCLDETAATGGQLHQMKDQEGAARCVCDWSETARTAEAAYALVDRALADSTMLRRRPCHVSVPIGLLESRADAAPAAPGPVIVAGIGAKTLAPLAHELLAAKAPVFILGGGAVRAGGPDSPLRRILARLGAASFTTYAGRGITDPTDPRSFGATLARPESADILACADCVVVIGSDLSEVDLWRSEAGYAPGAHIVNIDPAVLARAYPDDRRWQVDAVAFATALEDALNASGGTPSARWQPDDVAPVQARWRAEIAAERPGILPVADVLRAALPEDTTIYSDMTQFAYAAKEVWPMTRPGHWHHPFGFGTLGYALPAAIGGKIGLGDAPVIAIAGDYGFQYTLQELAVAVELELCLPIILWDNGKLGEIADSMVRAQIAPNAVVQRNPDFVKLAAAYGAAAVRPRTLADLQQAVAAALAHPGPTLIHVASSIAASPGG